MSGSRRIMSRRLAPSGFVIHNETTSATHNRSRPATTLSARIADSDHIAASFRIGVAMAKVVRLAWSGACAQ